MEALKKQLIDWADEYESPDFIDNDPIQFPRSYFTGKDSRDVEINGFITAWLSYGSRKQIINKAKELHGLMDWKPYDYLMRREWLEYKESRARLYRFYTYGDYYELLQRLFTVYENCNTLEEAVIFDKEFIKHDDTPYITSLKNIFEGIAGIPGTENAACKRLAMFLRWMIRQGSPVDMGIWGYCYPEKLIIPLDTHVQQQALKLGITKRKTADMKTAIEITDYFKEIFPKDPARGDFALFGYGVNND